MTSLFFTDSPTENEEIFNVDAGNQPETVTPSTAKKGPARTPRNVSFTFDSSLTQASAVSKEMADAASKNDQEEEKWQEEEEVICDGTSGTRDNTDGQGKKPPYQQKERKSEGQHSRSERRQRQHDQRQRRRSHP